MAEQGVSLKPSDAVAGGLLDDFILEWTDCKFEMFDYQGKSAPAPCFHIVGKDVDTGEDAGDYWSVGRAQDWQPSADGKELIPVGNATELKNSTKLVMLLTSIINSGFPEGKIENDATVFNGMVAHMIRVPAPKGWSNMESNKPAAEDGKEFAKTVLVVDEIKRLPWEKKAAAGAPGKKKAAPKKAAAKKAAAKPDAAAAGGGGDASDIDDVCTGIVLEAIEQAEDGRVPKKALTKLAFAAMDGDDRKSAVVQRIHKDEFLGDGPWSMEDGVVFME